MYLQEGAWWPEEESVGVAPLDTGGILEIDGTDFKDFAALLRFYSSNSTNLRMQNYFYSKDLMIQENRIKLAAGNQSTQNTETKT